MPELITGTKGTPHITSTQDRAIYEKIIGKNSYILDDNELLEPELQSNQSLRIRSGMLYHHGSITEVKRNTYDEVTIANGSQGMKRIDLVVARYTKNPETEIEEMNWVVIQGTPAASDPVAPAYTEGNMQEGDLTDDCPVFEVHLDGIQVTEVVKLLTVLSGSLESLNSKIPELIGQAGYNGSVSIGDIPAGTELLIVAECAISAGSRSSFSWSVIKQESGTGHYMDGFTYSQNYRGAVGITVTPVSVSFWNDWTQFLDGQTPISKSSNSIRVYSK